MTREQRILRNNALIIIGFGVAFAAAAWTPIYQLISFFFDIAHWPLHSAPEALDPTGRLMIAISGGLTVGMGAMVWAVATDVLPVVPVAGRRVIRLAAFSWFAVDSTFSVVAGSPFNVVLNLSFLGMMVWPLQKEGPAVADPA